MDIDSLLAKRGLKFEQLEPEERETLNVWLSQLNQKQLTLPQVKDYISRMRDLVSDKLSEIPESPTTWLSLVSLFFPFLGIIRHWYVDQKRVALTARLKNYILLEAMLSAPEKAKAKIEASIASIPKR